MKNIIYKMTNTGMLGHISLNFIYKVLGLGLSLLVVPLTINYLDNEKYGIWATILSLLTWVTFFDVGLGNGLRNKLCEAINKEDKETQRGYISTSYILILLISLFIATIFLLFSYIIDWKKVFNTNILGENYLQSLIIVVVLLVLINFVLSLCNSIFYAFQRPSITGLNNLLSQVMVLISVVFLGFFSSGNLILLGIAYGISLLVPNLIFSLFFFFRNRDLAPSMSHFSIKYVKELTDMSVKFFIIQICVMIVFTTDNIIIIQVLGPTEVTSYSVVYKLFNLITTIHSGVILNTLWSKYTDLYSKKEYISLKTLFSRTLKLMIVLIVIIIILMLVSKTIISFWISNDELTIKSELIILMAIYTLVNAWNSTFAIFLNGIGRINLQTYTSIAAALLNIPVSVFFAKYMHMGSGGVILGTLVSLSLGAILMPMQVRAILKITK